MAIAGSGPTGLPWDVNLLPPLALDLRESRLLPGRPRDKAPIIRTSTETSGSATTGGTGARARLPASGARRRRDRGYAAVPATRLACVAAPVGGGSHYVAEQAGHSVATLARYYAGVIKELHGQPNIPAAEAIREARERISCTAYVRHAERA